MTGRVCVCVCVCVCRKEKERVCVCLGEWEILKGEWDLEREYVWERECERDSEMNGQEQLPTFCLRIFAERRVVGEKSIFICLHIVGSCVVKSNKKEIYFHLNNLNEKQCKQKLFLDVGRRKKQKNTSLKSKKPKSKYI